MKPLLTLDEIRLAILKCPKYSVEIKTPPQIDGDLNCEIETVEVKMLLNYLTKRIMTDNTRKKIVSNCKKQDGWYEGETSQDKLIQQECEKLGFTFSEFFGINGKTLNKILKI